MPIWSRHVCSAPRADRVLALLLASSTIAACGGGEGDTDPGPTGPVTGPVPVFTAHLTDVARVRYIVPPGSVSGDELKGHSFVQGDGSAIPIYAPVDMTLIAGTWVGLSDDYGFEFRINDRFRLRLGHITDPRADIRGLIPRTDPSSIFTNVTPLLLRAGELIGTTTGTVQTNGFDFGLYDLATDLITPNSARWRTDRSYTQLNSVCAFQYFDAGLRPSYYARFGNIGGQLVSGASCRTIADVTGPAGGVAGEWFLAAGTPAGDYQRRFAIGNDLSGASVRVSGIGPLIDVVGGTDPRTVTSSICYAASDASRHVAIRLVSANEADVVAGVGACPADFPAGSRRYAR